MVGRRVAATYLLALQWVFLLLLAAHSIGIPLPLPDQYYSSDVLFRGLAAPWALGVVALVLALLLLSLPPRSATTPFDLDRDLMVRHDRLRFTSWLLLHMGWAVLFLALINLFFVPLVIPNWVMWLLGVGLWILGSAFGSRALDLTQPHGRVRYSRNRLARAERRNGPDGVEVLLVRAELATHLDEAITAYEVVVAELERSFGPDHIRTLAARADRAHYCCLADRRAEAVRMYESVLADSERVLGSDHRATRKIREHLLAARDGRAAP